MNSIFAEDLKLYFLKITTEKFEELVKLQKAYKEILGGKKKYEYRTRYTNKETVTFIYVSQFR